VHLSSPACPIAANPACHRRRRSIQGKSLVSGTPHDEMVESFGITWCARRARRPARRSAPMHALHACCPPLRLLAGTSLGHIVGAGAILGMQASGVF